MGIARGIATSVQMWNESTFGVDPVSISAEKMFFRTFNPSGSLKRLMDETITGRRGMPSSIAGDKDVTGQILTTFAPESALRYLQHLIGGPATSGASAPYTHVFSLAGALPVGFGMQVDYGSTLSAPGRYLHLLGCRIAKGSFKFMPSGFVDATYDVRGSNFNLSDLAVADAAAAEYGHTGFSMFSAAVKEGGASIGDLAEVTLDWDNDLDDTLRTIGQGGVRGDLPEGFAKLTGTATALFKNATLMDKALASTTSSLNLILQHGTGAGTAGNEHAEFDVPALKWEMSTPPIDGPKGLKVSLKWTAERVGSAELAAAVTIKSARATV